MKKTIKAVIYLLVVCLVVTNIYIFVVGIQSSNEVSRMEKSLEKLRQENIDLESQLSQIDSLEYAASIAASLDFEKKAVPTYLDSLKYALNR